MSQLRSVKQELKHSRTDVGVEINFMEQICFVKRNIFFQSYEDEDLSFLKLVGVPHRILALKVSGL